ncbi:FG-GAP-like repeat-containing protein [Mariniblastus fucicola]|uniref:FG-GAP repeat protein n=1 Tax=Mariniblastus fucicola TaxID=980251 RepID=A0A5B9PDA2_9BACT|nr:FG-GAP-like repeat-containing protein [Mariniblastus fucicola]QEG22892.1 FG-GAP repeat protein [Mariniblastus fucicola]
MLIKQPCGNFPKGVAILDLDGDSKNEVVVIPKKGDLWQASFDGDASKSENWSATPIKVPGAMTRMKMDNVYLVDIDGDGDQDIATTEENGGWGVIWFENPSK